MATTFPIRSCGHCDFLVIRTYENVGLPWGGGLAHVFSMLSAKASKIPSD